MFPSIIGVASPRKKNPKNRHVQRKKHLGYPAWFEWNPGINLTTRNCWWVFSNSFSHVIRLLCQLVAKINLRGHASNLFFLQLPSTRWPTTSQHQNKKIVVVVFFPTYQLMFSSLWKRHSGGLKRKRKKKHIEKHPSFGHVGEPGTS